MVDNVGGGSYMPSSPPPVQAPAPAPEPAAAVPAYAPSAPANPYAPGSQDQYHAPAGYWDNGTKSDYMNLIPLRDKAIVDSVYQQQFGHEADGQGVQEWGERVKAMRDQGKSDDEIATLLAGEVKAAVNASAPPSSYAATGAATYPAPSAPSSSYASSPGVSYSDPEPTKSFASVPEPAAASPSYPGYGQPSPEPTAPTSSYGNR